MLYNIPCRIYILSTLSLCISGIVSTATATSSETKNQQRRDARRDHESFGKQPLGKPGDYTGY